VLLNTLLETHFSFLILLWIFSVYCHNSRYIAPHAVR